MLIYFFAHLHIAWCLYHLYHRLMCAMLLAGRNSCSISYYPCVQTCMLRGTCVGRGVEGRGECVCVCLSVCVCVLGVRGLCVCVRVSMTVCVCVGTHRVVRVCAVRV